MTAYGARRSALSGSAMVDALPMRCQRCGEALRPSQQRCAACGTAVDAPREPTIDELDRSSLFLVPNVVPSDTAERWNQREHHRLLLWIALGLAGVSVVGGLLYTLYYLRVGNRVTALLPRDTVAYVKVGSVAALEEAFLNLDLWETSRPVRERLRRAERRLVQAWLLDVGINLALLEEVQAALTSAHLAVVPAERMSPAELPYDVLFFLELRNAAVREKLLDRMAPFFQPAGDEGGVPFSIRRTGSSSVSMAEERDFVIICWGSDASLRDVLRRAQSGPSRSLDDAEAFRTAWRNAGRRSDVWAYIRHDDLIDLALGRLLGPMLSEPQRGAVQRHAHLLRHGGIEGVGLSIDVRGGIDLGRLGLYPAAGDDIEHFSDRVGVREKRTLASMPDDAVLAVAVTADDPGAIFSEWRGPVLDALSDLGAFGRLDDADSAVNHFQAASGVYFTKDIWPNLTHEAALAWLPREDGGLERLLVVAVNSVDRALDVVARIARHRYLDMPSEGVRYEVAERDGFGVVLRSAAAEDAPEEMLCWTASGSKVLVAGTCGPIRRARAADEGGRTLDRLPAVSAALDALPGRNSALVIGRLRELLERSLGPRSALEIVSRDFVAAAALTVAPERIEVAANVSPLALSFLWLAGLLDRLETPADDDPCVSLVSAVCGAGGDRALCDGYRSQVSGSSRAACATALRMVQAFDARETP